MAKKSWKEKFYVKSDHEIKTTQKSFWGFDSGSKMLIPSPTLIQSYINQSEVGQSLSVQTMRKDLAMEHGADFTCPMTTGIFLRIVAEYNYHKLENNNIQSICPFWRIIEPGSKLYEKLSFDNNFIIRKRTEEEI